MSSKGGSSKQGDDSSTLGRRRGTYVPRKNSVLEGLNKVIKRSLDIRSSSEIDLSEVQPWLEKVQRKGPYAVKDGKVLHEVFIPDNFCGIYSARYSPDGSVIATSFGAGAIQLRKAEDGSLLHTVRGPVSHGIPAMSLRFHPNRQDLFYAASACGHIFMCNDQEDQHKKFVHEKKNEVNTIDINNTAKLLVSGGKDAILRVYDVNNAKLVLTYPSMEYLQSRNGMRSDIYHKSRIFAVKFHPDRDNIFFSGGWDDVVKVWDLRVHDTCGCIANIRGPHICGDSIDVRGNTVLTGSWTANNSIQIWDLTTCKTIDTITPQNRPQTIDGEFLYCAQFFYGDSTGNTILTGGSGSGLVEVISIADRKVICFFKLNKTVQTIDSHYDRVVFGGMENFFKIAEYVGSVLVATCKFPPKMHRWTTQSWNCHRLNSITLE